MEDRRTDVAGRVCELFVGLKRCTRHELLGLILSQRWLRGDATRQPQRIGGDPAVFVGHQIATVDRGRCVRIAAANADVSARCRSQITDARSECRKTVQRLAKLVERQRLHVELYVWCSCSGDERVKPPS